MRRPAAVTAVVVVPAVATVVPLAPAAALAFALRSPLSANNAELLLPLAVHAVSMALPVAVTMAVPMAVSMVVTVAVPCVRRPASALVVTSAYASSVDLRRRARA